MKQHQLQSRREYCFSSRKRIRTIVSSAATSVLFLMMVVACYCCNIVEATIKLQDTNKKYSSQIDGRGKQLWKGYDYFARLQHIPGELCLNGDNNKTIVPSTDHLPIALILKSGGGCTLEENIRYVTNHIQPEGHVGFLIVDTPLSKEETKKKATVLLEKKKPTLLGGLLTWSGSSSASSFVKEKMHHLLGGGKKKNRHDTDDDDDTLYPFFILHVTYDAEFDLLDAVYHQDDDTRLSGGPRITVDNKTASSPYWIAIFAIIFALFCSFCIILQSWLEVEPEPELPPIPNGRRRLTRQQVRNLLPTYKYDGSCQLIHSEDPERGAPVISQENMDCCSICLDDYEPGNVLRILACNHVYHAKCIGKWLVERSAVCPLCKEEVLLDEEEDEEEENQLEQGQNPLESEESVWRRIYQTLVSTSDGENNDEQASGEPQSAAANITSEQLPWWSRLFRRQVPVAESSDLTEPLLANEDQPLSVTVNDDNIAPAPDNELEIHPEEIVEESPSEPAAQMSNECSDVTGNDAEEAVAPTPAEDGELV